MRIELYKTKIECSSHNILVNSTDTLITVSLVDFNGNPVTDTEATVSVDTGYFTKYTRNNTDVMISGSSTQSYTGKTGSDGTFTLKYTATNIGLATFTTDNYQTQVNITKADDNTWETITLNNPSSTFELFVNEHIRLCELRMNYTTNSNVASGDHGTSTSVPVDYRPSGVVVGSLQLGGSLRVTSAGAITWTLDGNIGAGMHIYGSVVYHY
ncbi:MAG: hypothetical protein IJH63_00485 [Methanobrevibacter sp.]|nr:hypothetical protein [Methanosphaera sp.]MBR0369180.1 hypothetical protein [Methanobrevibacter sp.]